mgnify:CR=1 FL=1
MQSTTCTPACSVVSAATLGAHYTSSRECQPIHAKVLRWMARDGVAYLAALRNTGCSSSSRSCACCTTPRTNCVKLRQPFNGRGLEVRQPSTRERGLVQSASRTASEQAGKRASDCVGTVHLSTGSDWSRALGQQRCRIRDECAVDVPIARQHPTLASNINHVSIEDRVATLVLVANQYTLEQRQFLVP